MRISDWSSDVCSSDLRRAEGLFLAEGLRIATEAREAGVLPAWLFLGPSGTPCPAKRSNRRASTIAALSAPRIARTRSAAARLSGARKAKSRRTDCSAGGAKAARAGPLARFEIGRAHV